MAQEGRHMVAEGQHRRVIVIFGTAIGTAGIHVRPVMTDRLRLGAALARLGTRLPLAAAGTFLTARSLFAARTGFARRPLFAGRTLVMDHGRLGDRDFLADDGLGHVGRCHGNDILFDGLRLMAAAIATTTPTAAVPLLAVGAAAPGAASAAGPPATTSATLAIRLESNEIQ